ncbi:GatB/YqeY domain-containing protein [Mesorhizobium sp. LHD-90]|uniref:GatB/YqeY domain-containing protein n=1 Tax=Mesorhizobium sp. LHD-90 TaxID=3071414 RepID=UPI0027E1BCD3|nr:GatB/YqeY domain-containing protein [Mesorhizobium sp. LHD-90]MDQ6436439.1 GatB/YqeY domain-containing protein [Mesorhizobium sp. LHD-90]
MRTAIAEALKTSLKAQDKRRTSTLRLINAAIQDRDIANRGAGKDPVNDEEILQILAKMVKQREESAAAFEQGNRLELAEQERQEIEIIREFLPKQLGEEEVKRACRQVVDEVGAEGLRDMGRCMNALKEKYPGKMDFGKASGIVKSMLQ